MSHQTISTEAKPVTYHFHGPSTVQLGNHNTVDNRPTNQENEDVDAMKCELEDKIEKVADDVDMMRHDLDDKNKLINKLTDQLKEERDSMKDELAIRDDKIEKLTDEVETLTCGMNQLTERVGILEDKNVVKKTNVNKNSNKKTKQNKISDKTDEMITLTIHFWGWYNMTISISKDKSVDELDKMIKEGCRKEYGRDDDGGCIHSIYSNGDEHDKYNHEQHNKHLTLRHFNVTGGDRVLWRPW